MADSKQDLKEVLTGTGAAKPEANDTEPTPVSPRKGRGKKNALRELADDDEDEGATDTPPKHRKWLVTVGDPRNPLVSYNLRTAKRVTADQAYAQYQRETGRGEPAPGLEPRCTPLDD